MVESVPAQRTGAAPARFRLLLLVLALPFVTIAYAIPAAMHPVVGSSLIGVVFLALLLVAGLLIFFAQRNRDLLDPLRLVAAFFVLVYCINPLLGGKLDWYFVSRMPDLVAQAGAFGLVGLACIVLGYHLPLFRPFPRDWTPRISRAPGMLISVYSLGLFGVGFAAYVALFVSAGGIQGIIASEEHRMEFTRGLGALLHASLFMFSGSALYFASRAPRSRRPWLAAWPLGAAFLLFLLLQNRSRAFWAVAIFLVVWHYQVRPLRLRVLAPYALVLGVLFIFVGFARQASIRPLLLTNPVAVVQEASSQFGEVTQGTLGFSLNRLQQLMLAIDSFPDRAPYEWGRTLTSMLNPVFRLIGLEALQARPLGETFFRLAHPEAPLDQQNGYHPSLLGELLANFPWYLALFAAAGYGIALRALYTALIVKRRDFASIALYAAAIYGAASMVMWGVGTIVFRIVVIAVPILLVLPLVPREIARPLDAGR